MNKYFILVGIILLQACTASIPRKIGFYDAPDIETSKVAKTLPVKVLEVDYPHAGYVLESYSKMVYGAAYDREIKKEIFLENAVDKLIDNQVRPIFEVGTGKHKVKLSISPSTSHSTNDLCSECPAVTLKVYVKIEVFNEEGERIHRGRAISLVQSGNFFVTKNTYSNLFKKAMNEISLKLQNNNKLRAHLL